MQNTDNTGLIDFAGKLQDQGEMPMTYIRPVLDGVTWSYAVCTSDGVQLAVFPTYDSAYYTARIYNLDPAKLH